MMPSLGGDIGQGLRGARKSIRTDPNVGVIAQAQSRARGAGARHGCAAVARGVDATCLAGTLFGGGSLELVAALSVVNVVLVAAGLTLAPRLGVRI
jgi:hypothetical protein